MTTSAPAWASWRTARRSLVTLVACRADRATTYCRIGLFWNRGAAGAAHRAGSRRGLLATFGGHRPHAAGPHQEDPEHASGGGLRLRDGRALTAAQVHGGFLCHPATDAPGRTEHARTRGAKLVHPVECSSLAPWSWRAPRWAGRR